MAANCIVSCKEAYYASFLHWVFPLFIDRFVCGIDEVADEVQRFAHCLDAMNCAQLNGMTTGVKAQSEKALFLYHMIPHHQNAVNVSSEASPVDAMVLLTSSSFVSLSSNTTSADGQGVAQDEQTELR